MRIVLRTIDPRHGRDIPTGRKIARALRVIFRRQQREVMAKLRQNPERVPSLVHWTAPMAAAMEPLLHGYYAEGIRAAMRRIRRQLRGKYAANLDHRKRLRRAPNRARVDRNPDRDSLSAAGRSRGEVAAELRGVVLGRRLDGDRATHGLANYRGTSQVRRRLTKDEGDPARVLDVFDPSFDVFNPRVLEAIRQAVYQFCDATNQTATRELGQAIQDLRRELSTGLERGEALSQLTARVQEIFDDPMRAFRIATTEASRAVHAGQLIAAEESGVVQGKRWLASSDACPLCLPLDGVEVPLDQPFVIAGTGPYAVIQHPPRHPH